LLKKVGKCLLGVLVIAIILKEYVKEKKPPTIQRIIFYYYDGPNQNQLLFRSPQANIYLALHGLMSP